MGTHNLSSRRRAVIALAALSVPFSALSQTPLRAYRIGFLVPRSSANFKGRVEAFQTGLRELGYVEGKNLTIEWRFADGEYGRLPMLANELIQSRIDVLVVDSTPGVKVAHAATTTIPIVMISVGDPVASGFVASLARPGGNITGLSNVVGDVSAKYVELLHVVVPNLRHIVVLTNPDNSTHAKIANQVRTSAATIGVKVAPIAARTPADIEAAFRKISKDGAGALIVLGDPFFGQQGPQIGELAMESRVPTLLTNRTLAEAGGLMSYGQDLSEHYRRAAVYVDKILKGAKPRDLPVEQSTKIELVINMKTAKAIGLTIPQSLLLRADDVIR
jgi:putative ABC transport system substrate-binding protein